MSWDKTKCSITKRNKRFYLFEYILHRLSQWTLPYSFSSFWSLDLSFSLENKLKFIIMNSIVLLSAELINFFLRTIIFRWQLALIVLAHVFNLGMCWKSLFLWPDMNMLFILRWPKQWWPFVSPLLSTVVFSSKICMMLNIAEILRSHYFCTQA